MASIDVDKQVLSEWIKKALNYLSAGGRDIVLKSERVAIEHLLRGRDVLAIYLSEERDDENEIIRDKLLLFYSCSISPEEYLK